jgi:hypothetical protein
MESSIKKHPSGCKLILLCTLPPGHRPGAFESSVATSHFYQIMDEFYGFISCNTRHLLHPSSPLFVNTYSPFAPFDNDCKIDEHNLIKKRNDITLYTLWKTNIHFDSSFLTKPIIVSNSFRFFLAYAFFSSSTSNMLIRSSSSVFPIPNLI